MENVNRVRGYGVYEEDPQTGRGYFTQDDRNGIPNAVPAIRMMPLKPLGDVTNKIRNPEYKPTMNNYVEVKKSNGTSLVRVIPIEKPQMVPMENDFGWTEISESRRHTNHSALIPSAGHHFKFGKVLPDLLMKVVRV